MLLSQQCTCSSGVSDNHIAHPRKIPLTKIAMQTIFHKCLCVCGRGVCVSHYEWYVICVCGGRVGGWVSVSQCEWCVISVYLQIYIHFGRMATEVSDFHITHLRKYKKQVTTLIQKSFLYIYVCVSVADCNVCFVIFML